MEDVRQRFQPKVLWRGKIYFKGGLRTIDCTIRNISEGGAKLEIDPTNTIPDEFELHIPERDRSYHVKIVWRDAKHLGVQFLEKIAAAAESSEPAVLKEENRKLRTLNKALADRLESLGVDVSLFVEQFHNTQALMP